MEVIELLLLRGVKVVTTEERMNDLRKWLLDNKWIERHHLSHPSTIRLFDWWARWWNTPTNDNKLYEDFKKVYYEIWGADSWNELLFYTWALHPTYVINKTLIADIDRTD